MYCVLAQNVGTPKHRPWRLRILMVYYVSKVRVKSGWHSINDLEITMKVSTSTQSILNAGRIECLFFLQRGIQTEEVICGCVCEALSILDAGNLVEAIYR